MSEKEDKELMWKNLETLKQLRQKTRKIKSWLKPHHGINGTKHVGRLRKQVSKILKTTLNLEIKPDRIYPATGSYRTCRYHDVYRWEANGRDESGSIVSFGCFDTMTVFIKEYKDGFYIDDMELCLGEPLYGKRVDYIYKKEVVGREI